MFLLKKTLSLLISAAILFSSLTAFAEDTWWNIDLVSSLQAIIKKHEETIKKLQDENQGLKAELDKLSPKKSTGTLNIESSQSSEVTSTTIKKVSSVEKYNILVNKINSISASIFTENSLPNYSAIWLFEFIEPSNFFISIDDFANPDWVTAFKRKILYSYDGNYNLKVEWIFELDYKTQYYITKSWKNPFAKAKRIRIKNPIYKWKLLDDSWEQISSSNSTTIKTSTWSTTPNTSTKTTTTTSTPQANVTIDSIKSAYNKNNILEALKLSNTYILTDPNNLEVLKIRYRSFYMLGKYADALNEIIKIEGLITAEKMDKLIACDAKIISKLAKDSTANSKYTTLCNSKK